MASGGTASFTVTYANLYWIPEVSLTCGATFEDVILEGQYDAESQYEVTPWHLTFPEQLAAGTCTATLYYFTWTHCRDPHDGPFYCTRQTGYGELATVTFTVGP